MKMRDVQITAEKWSGDIGRAIDGALRDVQQILNGGLRLADQARVRTFRWNSALAASKVDVGTKVPPLALLVLGARPRTQPSTVISGAEIVWTWDGRSCVVSSVGSLVGDFDVTVLVVEG